MKPTLIIVQMGIKSPNITNSIGKENIQRTEGNSFLIPFYALPFVHQLTPSASFSFFLSSPSQSPPPLLYSLDMALPFATPVPLSLTALPSRSPLWRTLCTCSDTRSSPSRRVRSRHRAAKRQTQLTNDKWDRVQPTSSLPRRPQASSVSPSSSPRHNDLRPENCPALVLNADYSPLSYMPLSIWNWQDTIKAVILDRVTVVETYDIGVRSPTMMFPLPSVISLKQYQPTSVKKPAFTRFNVFLRDEFKCQYCGAKFHTQHLTFDHVVPRCLGGTTNWMNVVTACVKCNHAKGRKLLSDLKGKLSLIQSPRQPNGHHLQQIAKRYPPRYLHETWRDYVYWSQALHVDGDSSSEHNGTVDAQVQVDISSFHLERPSA